MTDDEAAVFAVRAAPYVQLFIAGVLLGVCLAASVVR